MVANLDGLIFDQIYGDNSGAAEFDTDGDGTTTQEDEFVAVRNTSGADVDLSGWEIWSDMTGSGAPDSPQDGKFHTFPPGTVIKPGETLFVINEITGTPKGWMQEASEGGVESGAGGVNTNFLSEGASGAGFDEAVALVNPTTGEYIVLHFGGDQGSDFEAMSGFPGTTKTSETNAAIESGVEDMDAGSSYQYNSVTDSYELAAVSVPCFASGTRITVPGGEVSVEDLAVGDLVETLDHGPRQVRAILRRDLDFHSGADARHKPVEFKPGTLGDGRPRKRLVVSPQHRMLIRDLGGHEVLAPAKGLTGRRGVRVMRGRRTVTYVQLVFDRHEIVCAEGAWTESFYPGAYVVRTSDLATKQELFEIFPELLMNSRPAPARTLLGVRETRRLALDQAAPAHCVEHA